MASFEAFEIERQGRALRDQTAYFDGACTNIIEYLQELANQFKGTALESTISQFSSEYDSIKEVAKKRYIDLSEVMIRWANNTIANELQTTENIQKYNQQIQAMIEVIVRKRSGE